MPPLYPLAGTVTKDGKPVAGGGLIFVSESSESTGLTVNASVGADGRFSAITELTSRSGKTIAAPGVPLGKYKAIYHPLSDGSKSGLEVELTDRVTVETEALAVTLRLPSALPTGTGEPRDDANPPPSPEK